MSEIDWICLGMVTALLVVCWALGIFSKVGHELKQRQSAPHESHGPTDKGER